MEEGYPGNLDVTIEFTLADHTLNIHYHAQSDQDTLVNLTNHSYFNLDGEPSYIGDHVLKLACEEFDVSILMVLQPVKSAMWNTPLLTLEMKRK